MRVQLLFVVIAFLALSSGARAIESEYEETDCDVDAVWKGSNDTESEWSNAENWQDAKLPTELSKVLLLDADTIAVLGNNDKVQISSARIGSQSLLRITSGSKLTIFNREVACFDTNWCSGHGECVGVNECECEPGWGGEACSFRTDCEEGEPTQCGFCPDADIACNCGDSLYDQPQEYVSRLLLLETTAEMQVSIAATIAKLETIKNLNKGYNPYTEVLEEDMVEWIREMQEFADGPLLEIANDDTMFLEDLTEVADRLLPDPCDATPEQRLLEEQS